MSCCVASSSYGIESCSAMSNVSTCGGMLGGPVGGGSVEGVVDDLLSSGVWSINCHSRGIVDPLGRLEDEELGVKRVCLGGGVRGSR